MPAHLLILVLHGGAFVMGTPAVIQSEADALGRLAPRAQVLNVAYPLGSPDRAYQYVRRVAVRHRGPVAVYGFSAGAHIATRLAARGEVDAAVTVSGVYHLDAWARFTGLPQISWDYLGISTAQGRRSQSPHPGPRAAPQLMLHGDRDHTAPLADAQAYDREDRRARLAIMHGVGHGQPYGPVRRAMRWLIAHAVQR